MRYPDFAEELKRLLEDDQKEIKAFSRMYYWHSGENTKRYKQQAATHKAHMQHRTNRMLHILDEIGEPSISNIGRDGAIAISVLATHDAARALQIVLEKFEHLYEAHREDCQYQSIPAMTDWMLILNKKPQRFGTQWLFDKNKWPFLPTVEDFEHIDERRTEYGIEPFRWPKSLAIPENEQPWLKRPLSELIMRELTDEERDELTK